MLRQTKVFHTTCFALSKQPAQVPSKTAAKLAKEYGAEISIDLNYTSKIWTDDINPINVVSEFLQLDPLLKISEDDVGRFLRTSIEHEEIMKYFQLEFGINRIYLTLDSQGVKYVDDIRKIKHLPAQPIKDVKDATGAGDASWSGFLYGFTNGFSQEQCLKMGLKLASIKLQHVGGWPEDLKFFWE